MSFRLLPRLLVCSALLATALLLHLAPVRADAVPTPLAAHLGPVTYVDFWASWCAPCAESFPWLNRMHTRYAVQGLRVVGVGLDAEPGKGDRFLKSHPPAFAIVRDPEGALAEHYGVEGMPYAVLLDAQGRVIYRHTGFRRADEQEYEQHIQAALAAQISGKRE